MKKIVIILMFLVFLFPTNSEELNDFVYITKTSPQIYESIKRYSIKEWGDNPNLITTEINNQCYYFVTCLRILNDTKNKSVSNTITEAMDFIINKDGIVDWLVVRNEIDELLGIDRSINYDLFINLIKNMDSFGSEITNDQFFKNIIGIEGDMNWRAFQADDDTKLTIVELKLNIPEYSGWSNFPDNKWKESKIQWVINTKTKVAELGYIGIDGEGADRMKITYQWAYAPLAKAWVSQRD